MGLYPFLLTLQCIAMHCPKDSPKYLFSCFRVDPTAKADGHENSGSPVEFAEVNRCDQVLVILQEFTEIPDGVKFDLVKQ